MSRCMLIHTQGLIQDFFLVREMGYNALAISVDITKKCLKCSVQSGGDRPSVSIPAQAYAGLIIKVKGEGRGGEGSLQ